MNLMNLDEIYNNFDVDRIIRGINQYYLEHNFKRNYNLLDDECVWLINQLNLIYGKYGFGLKTMARCFGLSYSQMRSIFKKFGIEIRIGRSVVTDRLRKHRKDRGKEEKNFFAHGLPKQCHTQRGVQGYYFSVYNNKLYWLRSSYEYIYAKWLDREGVEYRVEDETFRVDGIPYTPDFFIYESGCLKSVVEIKGYWKDKSWKIYSLNEVMPHICVALIEDIDPYIINGGNKQKELRKWKKERLLKLPE